MVSARQRQRPRQVLSVLLIVSVVVVTGALACSGGDDGDEDARSDGEETTTTSSTSQPTPLSPEEEVEATYLEFVDAVERLVSTTRDADDVDLNRLAVDPVLGELRDNLRTMQAENHVVEIGPRTSHRVTSVDVVGSTDAEVVECYVGNDTTTDADDGRVVDEGLSTRSIRATLVRQDEAWVVSDVATLEIYEGETSCDG